MKKWINLLRLGLLLCLSVILVGCNDELTTKIKTSNTTSNKTTSITTDKKTTNKTTSDTTNSKTTKKTVTTKNNVTTESHVTTKKAEVEAKSYLLSVFNNYSEAGETETFYRRKIKEKESVTLTTKVNDGYYFVGWSDASSSTIVSTNPTYTFNMPSKNLNIEAIYSYVTVTLVNSEESGTITKYENTKFSPGTSVTIKCDLDDGVEFDGWYDYNTGQLISNKTEYTFTMPKANVKYIAKYDYALLHLQMESYYNGTHYEEPLNPGSTQSGELLYKCKIGDIVTVSVRRSYNGSPNLIGLYDENDNLITENYSIDLEITSKEMYVVAKWCQQFALRHGNISRLLTTVGYKAKTDSEFSEFNGILWLRVGETYVLKAPDVEGYEFKGWYDTYLYQQTDSHTIEFEMPYYEHCLYPVYERTLTIVGQNGESYSDMHCTIQFKPYNYGDGSYVNINDDGTFTIRMGETYDLRVASVDEGYRFNVWLNSEGTSNVSSKDTIEITDDGSIVGYRISCTQISN